MVQSTLLCLRTRGGPPGINLAFHRFCVIFTCFPHNNPLWWYTHLTFQNISVWRKSFTVSISNLKLAWEMSMTNLQTYFLSCSWSWGRTLKSSSMEFDSYSRHYNIIHGAKHSPLSSQSRWPSGSNLAFHRFCVIFMCFPQNLSSFMMIHASNFLKHFGMKKKLQCEHIKSQPRLRNVDDKLANVFSILFFIWKRISEELFSRICFLRQTQ